MKLVTIEKLLVNSPLRAYELRKFEAPRVLSDLGIGEGSICLEIGCGNGIGALLINRYLNCEKIVGIDIDPSMVAAAKKRIAHPPKWARDIRTDNIDFFCEDATRLTFPDRYFDAVFIFGVLHHIREWEKAISEVYRVLKTGGTFSFEEALQSKLPSCFGRIKLFNRVFEYVPISEGELRDTLEKSGFSIRSSKTIKFLFMSGCFVRATKGGA